MERLSPRAREAVRQLEAAKHERQANRLLGAMTFVPGLVMTGVGALFLYDRFKVGRINLDGLLCVLLIGLPLLAFGARKLLR